jgi:hypothetical protein
MKKSLPLFLFLLASNVMLSQNWSWAKREGASYIEAAEPSATDAAGNTYALMSNYEDVVINGTTYAWCSQPGNILIKYSASGAVQWAYRICNHAVRTLDVDNAGNCIVGGSATSSVTMESASGTVTFAPSDGSDAFLAKYDAAGNLVWTELYDTDGDGEGVVQASADAAGNIYSIIESHFSFGGGNKFIITKHDPSSNLVWEKSSEYGQYVEGSRIAADDAGNIFVYGWASDSLIFEGDTTASTGAAPVTFLLKLDATGNLVWINKENGAVWGSGLEVAPSGNLYVTGYVGDELSLGTSTISDSKSILAKYDSNGNLQWFKSTNASVMLDVDDNENVYMGGGFYYPAVFDQDGVTLTSGQQRTMYIARYSSAGAMDWIYHHDGNADATTDLENISHDASENIYITGTFTDSLILGSTSYYNADSDVNQGDLFVAKFSNLSTGIQQQSISELQVNPNPTEGLFQVNNPFISRTTIRIFDVLGNIVYENTISDKLIDLDLSNYSSGIYLLRMDNENTSISKRIVKK